MQGHSMRNKTKVFLLGGQSNMVGSGDVMDLKPPNNEPLQSIKIWNPEKKWIVLEPAHDGRNEFDPEIGFAHEITKLLPNDDIRIIKYAANGTALYDDWSPVFKGPQYNEFITTANAAT